MSERKGQLRVVPVPSYHDMGPAERNELFVVAAVLVFLYHRFCIVFPLLV